MAIKKEPIEAETERRAKLVCEELKTQGWLSSFGEICCQQCLWLDASQYKKVAVITQESIDQCGNRRIGMQWKGNFKEVAAAFRAKGFFVDHIDEYPVEKGIHLGSAGIFLSD